MATGPGKYDDLCTYVREATNAAGVMLVVFDGNKGSGFSVQTTPEVAGLAPDILEQIVVQMRKDQL